MDTLTGDAVAKRGCIRVERWHGGIRIQLQPDNVPLAAYVELMHWLADQPEDRICLATDSRGQSEHIVGVPDIKRRLGVYVRTSRTRAEKRLNRSPLPACATGASSPIRGFRQLWEHGIDPSNRDFASTCNRHFGGCYTLSEAVDTGDLIIRMAGRGYAIYKKSFLARCAGLRLEDDPDLEYGQWVKEAHLDVLRSQQPLMEDVTVTFRGAGETERHLHYHRIVVPLNDGHGRKYLLSGSVRA